MFGCGAVMTPGCSTTTVLSMKERDTERERQRERDRDREREGDKNLHRVASSVAVRVVPSVSMALQRSIR